MKSPNPILLITVLSLLSQLLLISCSIQQRRYMPGFYVERHTGIEDASAYIAQKPESSKHLTEEGDDSQISLTIPSKQKSEEPTASVNSRKQIFLKKSVAGNKKAEFLFEKKEIQPKQIFQKENTIGKQNNPPRSYLIPIIWGSILSITGLIGFLLFNAFFLGLVLGGIAYLLLCIGTILGKIYLRRNEKEEYSSVDLQNRKVAKNAITISVILSSVVPLIITFFIGLFAAEAMTNPEQSQNLSLFTFSLFALLIFGSPFFASLIFPLHNNKKSNH